jgi:hypothetical protein
MPRETLKHEFHPQKKCNKYPKKTMENILMMFLQLLSQVVQKLSIITSARFKVSRILQRKWQRQTSCDFVQEYR